MTKNPSAVFFYSTFLFLLISGTSFSLLVDGLRLDSVLAVYMGPMPWTLSFFMAFCLGIMLLIPYRSVNKQRIPRWIPVLAILVSTGLVDLLVSLIVATAHDVWFKGITSGDQDLWLLSVLLLVSISWGGGFFWLARRLSAVQLHCYLSKGLLFAGLCTTLYMIPSHFRAKQVGGWFVDLGTALGLVLGLCVALLAVGLLWNRRPLEKPQESEDPFL